MGSYAKIETRDRGRWPYSWCLVGCCCQAWISQNKLGSYSISHIVAPQAPSNELSLSKQVLHGWTTSWGQTIRSILPTQAEPKWRYGGFDPRKILIVFTTGWWMAVDWLEIKWPMALSYSVRELRIFFTMNLASTKIVLGGCRIFWHQSTAHQAEYITGKSDIMWGISLLMMCKIYHFEPETKRQSMQ